MLSPPSGTSHHVFGIPLGFGFLRCDVGSPVDIALELEVELPVAVGVVRLGASEVFG